MSLQSTNEFQNAGIGPGFGGGFGNGIGGFGLVGLIGLLGGRRGLDGGDDDCCKPLITMSKLGDIQNDIRDSQGNVQAAVSGLKDVTQNQTLFLQNALATLALGSQQGFSDIKDTTQAGFALTNSKICAFEAAVAEGLCSVKQRIDDEAEKTRALINDINRETLNRQLSDAKNEIVELRTDGRIRERGRETEINVTQNVVQAQAQAQQQAQFNALLDRFSFLSAELQLQRQANKTVQFGTGNVAVPTNSANQVG